MWIIPSIPAVVSPHNFDMQIYTTYNSKCSSKPKKLTQFMQYKASKYLLGPSQNSNRFDNLFMVNIVHMHSIHERYLNSVQYTSSSYYTN